MASLDHLFAKNRIWSARITAQDPSFFANLAKQQSPEYLWIGCSDSRVPANQIVDLPPGEIFVHRNVSNVVAHTDLNCLSVIQFAVDVLKVKHIIVVGHYGCGGVRAALTRSRLGLVDNWLRHVQDVREKHAGLLEQEPSVESQADRLCELNVMEQVVNVCHTTAVREAWERGQDLTVHGWVYSLKDGLITELGLDVDHVDSLESIYSGALGRLSDSSSRERNVGSQNRKASG